MAADDAHLLHVERQLEALKNELSVQIKVNEALLQLSKPEEIPPAFEISQVSDLGAIAAIAGAAVPLLTATTVGFDAVTNIANLFRGDYTAKGKEIALSDTALRTLIAGKLNKWPVFLPHFYRITESNLIKTFDELVEERWTLQNQVHQMRKQIVEPKMKTVAELKVKIKKLKDQPSLVKEMQAKLEELTAEQQTAETAVLQSESLITAYDKSSKDLLTATAGQTASPMEVAVLREKISALGITHLLYATIVSSGGDVITSKPGLINLLKFGSGLTAYLGGSVVSYVLADVDGHIVAADTLAKVERLDYEMGSTEVPAFGKK